MLRAILFLSAAVAAMAQPPDPVHLLDTALQAAWKAIGDGRFEEIAAKREQARLLLRSVPADSPRFIAWVVQVSQLFQNSGWNARSRAALQESLDRSGNTSGPYLGDLVAAAQLYQASGKGARALPLLRKAIAVADLVATPNDPSPAETRMDAALALARLGEFDEAERLGEEAILRQRTLRTPRPPIEQELEMIRRMRNAAALHR